MTGLQHTHSAPVCCHLLEAVMPMTNALLFCYICGLSQVHEPSSLQAPAPFVLRQEDCSEPMHTCMHC